MHLHRSEDTVKLAVTYPIQEVLLAVPYSNERPRDFGPAQVSVVVDGPFVTMVCTASELEAAIQYLDRVRDEAGWPYGRLTERKILTYAILD